MHSSFPLLILSAALSLRRSALSMKATAALDRKAIHLILEDEKNADDDKGRHVDPVPGHHAAKKALAGPGRRRRKVYSGGGGGGGGAMREEEDEEEEECLLTSNE